MELTVENLTKIKRLSEKYAGFWRLEFTFFDLIELFGEKMWNWRRLFQHQEITIVDKQFNLKAMERRLILNALQLCNFKQREAAQLLGISQRSLNYWIKNNNYKHPSWRVNV